MRKKLQVREPSHLHGKISYLVYDILHVFHTMYNNCRENRVDHQKGPVSAN